MNKFLIFCFLVLVMPFALAQKNYVKTYHSNGKLKEEGWVSNNQKVDYWFFYNENGKLKEEGHFDEGQKVKWWIFYNSKGKVSKKSEFEANKLNGFTIIYDKSKVIRAEKYTMNKKTNEWESVEAFKKDNPFLFL